MRAATLDFLARHRRERLEPIADRLVATIQRENPAYRLDRVTRADLLHSCVTNVDRILELLALAVRSGVRPHENDDDPVYDAARATGRRRAEQGVQLDDVLRSFRMGGRLVWEDLVDRGEDLLSAGELRDIGTQLWEVVDATSAQVAVAYHALERSLVRADEQYRAEVWEGLLAGRGREHGFAREAALMLDVPTDADLVVVVAPHLDRDRAEEHLGPHATAWVRRTDVLVGLVVLRDDTPAEAHAALDAAARESAVAAGLSSMVAGLAGVDHGYREAVTALRAQGDQPGAVVLDARLPEALLLGAPEVAGRLVGRWVEPLTVLPRAEARVLLQTLRAWVAAGASTTTTAATVHCHRNTVVNRLRRVAELTGNPVGEDALVELDLALRAHRLGLGAAPSHP